MEDTETEKPVMQRQQSTGSRPRTESGTKIAGVEFAPLNIPLERRLQTLGAINWTCSFLFLGFGSLFLFIYMFFTSYYWVSLLYLAWLVWDKDTPHRGGRRVAWVRRTWIWMKLSEYFPLTLIKTADLHPSKNYLLCCHPHGVMATSFFGNFATDGTGVLEKYPGCRPVLLTLAGQYQFPFFRDYFMTTGSCSARKDSIEWLLTKEGTGNLIALIVGGAREALDAHPGSFKLNLNTRKGFIKIAMKHGTPLVPVYSFGENDIFDQVPNPDGSPLRTYQEKLMKITGFSMPLFRGRGIFNYSFGILPHRVPIATVVGGPIEVEKNENPTPEQVDAVHEQYKQALTALFEKHKTDYGIDENIHLEYY